MNLHSLMPVMLTVVIPLVANMQEQNIILFRHSPDDQQQYVKCTIPISQQLLDAQPDWNKSELQRLTNGLGASLDLLNSQAIRLDTPVWKTLGITSLSGLAGYKLSREALEQPAVQMLIMAPPKRSPMLAISAAQMLAPYAVNILATLGLTIGGLYSWYQFKRWAQSPYEHEVRDLRTEIAQQKKLVQDLKQLCDEEKKEVEETILTGVIKRQARFEANMQQDLLTWQQEHRALLIQLREHYGMVRDSLNLIIMKSSEAPELLANKEFMKRLDELRGKLNTGEVIMSKSQEKISNEPFHDNVHKHRTFGQFLVDEIDKFGHILHRSHSGERADE